MKNVLLLDARYLVLRAPGMSHLRMVMDYEFDLYAGGSRTMTVDGATGIIGKGALVFRKPGQVVQSQGDYNCYVLSLDFSDAPAPSHYSRNTATRMQPLYDHPVLNALPTVFYPAHAEEMEEILAKLSETFQQSGNTLETGNLVRQFLYQLFADWYLAQQEKTVEPPRDSMSGTLRRFMQEHLSEEISLEQLAQQAGVTGSYLVRIFRQETGTTPIAYLIGLRLERAAMYLNRTELNVSEIAALCGYRNVTFFSRSFRDRFGLSPTGYRQLFRAGSV